MKKDWLKFNSFADIIIKYNPFGFKEFDGSSMIFENYGKVYLYTLRTLAAEFPRGFIDIPLYLHHRTAMPLSVCKEIARKFHSLGLKDGIVLIEYWNPNTNPRYEFEKIMRAFHTISETTFSADYFAEAWRIYSEDMAKANTSERVITGSIVEHGE